MDIVIGFFFFFFLSRSFKLEKEEGRGSQMGKENLRNGFEGTESHVVKKGLGLRSGKVEGRYFFMN